MSEILVNIRKNKKTTKDKYSIPHKTSIKYQFPIKHLIMTRNFVVF